MLKRTKLTRCNDVKNAEISFILIVVRQFERLLITMKKRECSIFVFNVLTQNQKKTKNT